MEKKNVKLGQTINTKEAFMAKTVLIAIAVVLTTMLVGCYRPDSGESQLLPARMKQIEVVRSSEADLIEQMTEKRTGYRAYLESLVEHYKHIGNSMKLAWAKDELKKLDEIPQYRYIIEASVAGPDLRAGYSIAKAELVYLKAQQLEHRAKKLVVLVNANLLRAALDKYGSLIKQYPTSDRIDDAAYRSGSICEHFKDYSIALLYYQRTYQWNSRTEYPARYKAAYILDRQLNRRAEALDLYEQSLEKEDLSANRRVFIKERIAAITNSQADEKIEK